VATPNADARDTGEAIAPAETPQWATLMFDSDKEDGDVSLHPSLCALLHCIPELTSLSLVQKSTNRFEVRYPQQPQWSWDVKQGRVQKLHTGAVLHDMLTHCSCVLDLKASLTPQQRAALPAELNLANVQYLVLVNMHVLFPQVKWSIHGHDPAATDASSRD
jgi:hypothetical protein